MFKFPWGKNKRDKSAAPKSKGNDNRTVCNSIKLEAEDIANHLDHALRKKEFPAGERTTTPRLGIQNWYAQPASRMQSQGDLIKQAKMQRLLYLPEYGHWYQDIDSTSTSGFR